MSNEHALVNESLSNHGLVCPSLFLPQTGMMSLSYVNVEYDSTSTIGPLLTIPTTNPQLITFCSHELLLKGSFDVVFSI